jgi:hypothetical protein
MLMGTIERMNSGKDYHKVLGVNPDATEREIKSAYRRLARKYHPDLNPRRKSAERRFKELQEAYSALSVPHSFRQSNPSAAGSVLENDTPFGESFRSRLAVELNWRRKLALFLWLACTLLPTNFLHESPGLGLGVNTIPLLFVWAGDWLSDDDPLDVSLGSMFKSAMGIALMFLGWVFFARLVGGMVIAPIIIKMG